MQQTTPDAFAQFGFIDTVPYAEYILILAYADRTPTYLRPRILMRLCYARKLVANECKHEVLPYTIRDALPEAQDPLSAWQIKRVFPDGAADALVEEEVVGRWEECRGRV